MAARVEVTKRYATAYAAASKKDKGLILDQVVDVTGWNRDHARQTLKARLRQPKGRAVATVAVIDRRRTKPRKYSYDALVVLQEVWRLAPVRAAVGEASRRGHGRYFGTARPVPGAGQGAIPSESRSAR